MNTEIEKALDLIAEASAILENQGLGWVTDEFNLNDIQLAVQDYENDVDRGW